MYAYGFPIRVPADLLEALGAHTGHFWSSLELEPIICDMIRDYMKPPPAVQAQPTAPSEAGYQWKELFLPEGTMLRASFERKPYFATVNGAEIKYGEHAISPSCFANLHGSGNRNAWKAVWLRLPGSDQWLLADVCRSARKAAIARLLGGQAHEGPHQGRQPEQSAPPPPDKGDDKDKRPRSRETLASDIDGGRRAGVARRPATSQAAPRQTVVGPHGAPATRDDSVQRKKNAGRGGRRKRRAAKHGPGNP